MRTKAPPELAMTRAVTYGRSVSGTSLQQAAQLPVLGVEIERGLLPVQQLLVFALEPDVLLIGR